MPDPKVPERYKAPAEAYEKLGQFPHCDPLILHRPGSCEYCDAHPEWQALREVYEINFTGEDNPQKSPCPATKYRPAYQAHRWPGNQPSKGGEHMPVPMNPPTAWEHVTQEDWPPDRPPRRDGPPPVDRSARAVVGEAVGPGEPNVAEREDGQQRGYVVLSGAERARGFVRPVRHSYRHLTCGTVTTMGEAIAETYARDPHFYDSTYCAACRTHLPVGEDGEFVWEGSTEKVGT